MQPLADLARRFAFNDVTMEATTEGFEIEDWLLRAGDHANHAQWILGHLAATRRWAVSLLDGEMESVPWEQEFQPGTRPGGVSDDIAPEMLATAFTSAGRTLCGLLEACTPEQAQRPIDDSFPDGANTLAGAMHFLYFHETYHLGQLGLIRRIADKPGIA